MARPQLRSGQIPRVGKGPTCKLTYNGVFEGKGEGQICPLCSFCMLLQCEYKVQGKEHTEAK
eukprot:4461211-Ditylum_brightwellii.AAC.1